LASIGLPDAKVDPGYVRGPGDGRIQRLRVLRFVRARGEGTAYASLALVLAWGRAPTAGKRKIGGKGGGKKKFQKPRGGPCYSGLEGPTVCGRGCARFV